MEGRPLHTLLVVGVALLGIGSAMLLWFAVAGFGLRPQALWGAFNAARVHPLVLLWVVHLFFLLITAAAASWIDGTRRGLPVQARLVWAAAIFLLGVVGVWAYLARRAPPLQIATEVGTGASGVDSAAP